MRSELLCLRWLLEDKGMCLHSTTILHCNNHSAIQIAHNDVFHERIKRIKHIKIDCHFIQYHVLYDTIQYLTCFHFISRIDYCEGVRCVCIYIFVIRFAVVYLIPSRLLTLYIKGGHVLFIW